jgi:hypothetical protein
MRSTGAQVHRRAILAMAVTATMLAAGSVLGAQAGSGRTTVTGELRSESGQALPYAEVQACSATLCLYGESDANGRFRFELPATPAAFVIKTPEDVAAHPARSAALAPVLRAPARRSIDMGTVHVPQFAGLRSLPHPVAASRVEAGDGLELTIVGGELTPAPGKSIVALAARQLPPARIPAYELPRGETIVAVYALHPFGARSRSPVAVRAPATLAAGDPVRFRTIREIDGTFSPPVPGHATGTHVATEPGQGISELTHLVITR